MSFPSSSKNWVCVISFVQMDKVARIWVHSNVLNLSSLEMVLGSILGHSMVSLGYIPLLPSYLVWMLHPSRPKPLLSWCSWLWCDWVIFSYGCFTEFFVGMINCTNPCDSIWMSQVQVVVAPILDHFYLSHERYTQDDVIGNFSSKVYHGKSMNELDATCGDGNSFQMS